LLSISSETIKARQGNTNYYITNGVDRDFQESVFNSMNNLNNFSDKTRNAVSKIDNVIILKDSDSAISDEFSNTKEKLDKYATDAYGFVSRKDKAIVINEHNHQRKDVSLEGSYADQAADTVTHEIGHLIDEELSTTDTFKNAYLKDLKNIENMLNAGVTEIGGHDLRQMLVYLKHYMEGVDFSDGIDEKDITREGLRENFAECFSTIADTSPSEINGIYAALFPNTMQTTYNFVI